MTTRRHEHWIACRSAPPQRPRLFLSSPVKIPDKSRRAAPLLQGHGMVIPYYESQRLSLTRTLLKHPHLHAGHVPSGAAAFRFSKSASAPNFLTLCK